MKTTGKYFRHLAMAACALPIGLFWLTSCSEDENAPSSHSDEVLFTTQINREPVSRSNATVYAPSTGNLILFSQSLDANASSAKYTYDATTATWKSDAPLYWQNLKAKDSSPKYTFYGVAPSVPTGFSATVANDQTTAATFTAADLLAAHTTTDVIGTLNLVLDHMMSQVLVNVLTTNDDNKLSESELASAVVTIDGLKTGYTLTAATNGPVATVSGDAATGLVPLKEGTSFRFIAPAQSLAAGTLKVTFKVTFGDTERSFIYKAPAVELLAGTIKQFDITLSRTGVTMGNITVNTWSTAGESVSATVAISVDGASGGGQEESSLSEMKLWKGEEEMTDGDAPSSSRNYIHGDGSWSSSNPFFVDDVADASFYGMADNSDADPVTGLTDKVVAGPVTMDGTQISLDFKHLMSLLTVELVAGEGFSSSLEDAKVATPPMYPNYTLSYAETSKEIVLVPDGELKSYDLIPKQNHIVVPQTLKAGSSLVVTLKNGNKYEATLADDLVLAQGTSNTITLTLSPTDTSISVSVKDWVTGEDASAELSLVVSGTAGTPAGDAPAINTLQVGAVVGVRKDAVYTAEQLNMLHTYTLSDGKWSSTDPIYLDDLTADHVLYASTENVDADGNQIKDAVTGLYDYLGSDATRISGGTVAFSLRHLQAKMTVKLTKGTGFASDLTGAVITTPTMVTEAQIGTDGDGNMAMKPTATSTGSYNVSSEASYLVVPQTLAKDAAFTVKLANGNTYTANLANFVELKAGYNTTINLVLMPTSVAVKVAVTDWGTAAEATAEVKLAGLSAGSITYTANEGDVLNIYYNEVSTNEDAVMATFTYTGGTWTTTIPLYWDEISQNGFTGKFIAELIPDASTSPEKDILAGIVTGATYGGELNFTLNHSTAKLSFIIKGGTGVTNIDTEVPTRTLTLGKSNMSIAITDDGTFSYNTLTDGTVTIGGNEIFVAPQTLTDAHVVTLTRSNGNTYTVKLTDLMNGTAKLFADGKIVAGKHYAITITVNETSVGAKATVIDWEDKAGEATTALSITPGTDDLSAIVEAGDLTLTYVLGNAFTGTKTTYSYDGTSWTNDAPLYWDEIASEGYSNQFAALFVPDGWTVGQDFLYGKATTAAYGGQLNMTLKHAIAQLAITVKKGTGVTDEEVAALTRTVSFRKMDDAYTPGVNADGTANLELTAVAAHTFTDGTVMSLPQQALSNDHVITLTRGNGNKYIVKLSELKDTSGDAIFPNGIEGGKKYSLEVTVNEASLSISVTILDWTPVGGSGSVTPDF